jgi:hypothetical protein
MSGSIANLKAWAALLAAVTVSLVLLVASPAWAAVNVNNPTVTVVEGNTATNGGSYVNPLFGASNTTITASVGNVSKTGTTSGTWSWSFTPNDGPTQSHYVFIDARHSGVFGSTQVESVTFRLDVLNAEPTGTFIAPDSVGVGSTFNLSIDNATDASTADTAAGLRFQFDCGSGFGAISVSDTTSCSISTPGTHTVRGRVIDKDGGSSEYSSNVTVLPSLSINDVRVKEGSRNAVFTVSLSAANQQSVTVNYATANGSAKAPADYLPRSGTLTFAASGQTVQTVAVPIRNDRRDERNEFFSVNLSGANTTIADGSGSGKIIDNDRRRR